MDRGSATERLTAADAEDRQRRAAGALAASGLRAGDRVLFCLPSSADLLCAILGAARSGITPVLLNPALTADEQRQLVADAEPGLTVRDPAGLSALGSGPPVELAPVPLTRPMHYTSGTTGRPKGVVTGLWDERAAQEAFDDEAEMWGFGPGDVHLVCSPMHHSVSVRFAGGTLLSGGECIILGRFDAARALKALRAFRPTTAFLVPSHLRRLAPLVEAPDVHGGAPSPGFGSLRLLAHAGEPCPPHLKRAAMSWCPRDTVWEFYGSTEGQFTVCAPQEWLEHPGTVGRARPGRRLEIERLEAQDTGSAGEGAGRIWCYAPRFALFEYWRNRGATDDAWRDGAFTAGDIGHLDADGYLYLSGRREDLVISGGVNVYPAEVEAVLAALPGVREVAVFGLPDERWGQRVCAAVVAAPEVSIDDLAAAAAARLAPYKRPKQYFEVDELPHTATGKLRRVALAAHLGLAEGPAPS